MSGPSESSIKPLLSSSRAIKQKRRTRMARVRRIRKKRWRRVRMRRKQGGKRGWGNNI